MGTMKKRVTRRMFLGTVAASAVAAGAATVPALAGTPRRAGPQPRAAARTLSLTVVNDTGRYDNASVWIYVVGNDGTRQVHLTPEGPLAPVALSDNGPDGYTDYAIPLAAGPTTLRLPHMSGRIYAALGAKLKFKAVRDGNGNPALAYPAGWVASDPNYDVLHDCAEFTFNPDGMFCNTTMVDMFSVPMSLRLTGAEDQTTGTLRDGGRTQIFDALRGAGPFASLVVDDRRIIAPGHGLDAGLFPAGFFDGYIDQVWNAYASRDLRVTTNAGTFTGRVRDGRLAFSGPAEVSFARPSTRDVLFCHGALAAPNDGTTGPVAAILGAAFNRTTLAAHPDQPTGDPAGFYRNDPVHAYSRAMHEAAVDGTAYGFAFDDVGGFASYIQDGAPQSVTLTLTPF
jgi:hypothetical protein